MDIEQIEQAAVAKLDTDRNERIRAVKTLAEAFNTVERTRHDLTNAEQKHFQLYRTALQLGWTEPDLKGFGIDAPTKKVGGRPRKAKTAPRERAASSPSDSETSPEPSQALRAE